MMSLASSLVDIKDEVVVFGPGLGLQAQVLCLGLGAQLLVNSPAFC